MYIIINILYSPLKLTVKLFVNPGSMRGFSRPKSLTLKGPSSVIANVVLLPKYEQLLLVPLSPRVLRQK